MEFVMPGARKGFIATAIVIAAASSPVVANHSWDGLHWQRPNGAEVTAPVGDNVGPQWDKYLVGAVANWNKSTVIQSPVVAGTTLPAKCQLKAGTIQVCNAVYGVTGWLGLTSVQVSNGHISAMSSKLNDSYYNTPTYNTAGWRQYVVCHELGHAYGLAHQDEDFYNPNIGSCLDLPLNVKGNEGPNAHDYEMLAALYNHAESSLASANGVTSSGLEIGNSPKDWGKAIKFDRFGRPTVFVRILSPTERVLTDVLWAVGEGPRGRF